MNKITLWYSLQGDGNITSVQWFFTEQIAVQESKFGHGYVETFEGSNIHKLALRLVNKNIKVEEQLICMNNLPLIGNSIAPSLIEGQKYPIKEIYTCQCGQDHFDVGIKSMYNFITCYSCGKEIPRGDLIHWCHPSRFRNSI